MNRGLVSNWYNRRNLPLLYDELEDGDLLEFERQSYSHWAVYVGVRTLEGRNGVVPCVIHRMSPTDTRNLSTLELASKAASASSTGENIGPIVVEPLEDILGDSRVRINNQLDSKWAPFCPDEIIARAESLLAETNPKKYSVMNNNCEHFANRCRYGRNYSRQVMKGVVQASTSGLGVMLATAKVIRAVVPLAAAGNPMVAAAVSAAGVAVTVIPLVVQACQASRRMSQPPSS